MGLERLLRIDSWLSKNKLPLDWDGSKTLFKKRNSTTALSTLVWRTSDINQNVPECHATIKVTSLVILFLSDFKLLADILKEQVDTSFPYLPPVFSSSFCSCFISFPPRSCVFLIFVDAPSLEPVQHREVEKQLSFWCLKDLLMRDYHHFLPRTTWRFAVYVLLYITFWPGKVLRPCILTGGMQESGRWMSREEILAEWF